MSLAVGALLACCVNPHPPNRACRPCSDRSAQRSALQLHRGAARFDLLKTVPSRGGWAGHLHVLHTDDGCWTLSSGPTPTVECASECACTLKGMHPFVLGILGYLGRPSRATSLNKQIKFSRRRVLRRGRRPSSLPPWYLVGLSYRLARACGMQNQTIDRTRCSKPDPCPTMSG